jgi:DNA-binding FadR family transcriptional regulator
MIKEAAPQELRYIAENLLTLRRRLQISQQTFIQTYLTGPDGKSLISVSTLSNIENGNTVGVAELAEQVAQKLWVDYSVFLVEPDNFAKNIELFLGDSLDRDERKQKIPPRKISGCEALVQGISDYLMEALMSGELRPGSKLPPDRVLSARFGAGRTSIREALRVLSSLGIITILPGNGTFVASENTGFFNSVMSWVVLLSENSIEHLIDVRNELEAVSARLAAQRADDAAIRELMEINRKMEIAFGEASFKDFLNLDLDFHLAVARCSRNPLIYNLLATSRKMLGVISKSGMVTMEDLRNIYFEHEDIYAAIVAHNSLQAREMMEAHLSNARKRYHL